MRKKLFAILMSAMMMVTFMPAMAFATADAAEVAKATAEFVTVETAYDALAVSYEGETAYVPTTREIDTTGDDAGLITASVEQTVANNYFDDKAFANEEVLVAKTAEVIAAETVQSFYDLKDATITGVASEYFFADAKEAFTKGADGVYTAAAGIKLTVPSYVEGYGDLPTAQKTLVAGSDIGTDFVVTGFDNAVQTVNQNATVTFKTPASIPGQTSYVMYVGAAPSKAVLVKSQALGVDAVKFYLDDSTVAANEIIVSADATANQFRPYYDGAAHTIVNNAVEGVTVKYQKWNGLLNKYEDIDAVSFKDVADTVYYQVVLTKGTTTKKYQFSIAVAPANVTATLGAVSFMGYSMDVPVNVVAEGTEIKGSDFVQVIANPGDTAAAKAIKADEAALKEALLANFDVTATKVGGTAINSATYSLINKLGIKVLDVYTLAVTPKTTLAKDIEALGKAMPNFRFTGNGIEEGVVIVVEGNENELDFIGAVKKIKAGKSKMIKAEALSGVAPTFKKLAGNSKIKVAKNGKVTVKKSLKKGTYKIKVKATVAAGNGFKKISGTKVYKIKVVK